MAKYNIGQPFIVIADPRSGGSFLSTCVSSHPGVYCSRAEVLHPRDVPREVFPAASNLSIVRAFVEQQGWEACGVKVIYKHLTKSIVRWMEKEGVKAFQLIRENPIRVALSRAMFRAYKRGGDVYYPIWRYDGGGAEGKVVVDPLSVIAEARKYAADTRHISDVLCAAEIDTMVVRYADMVGGEGQEASGIPSALSYKICDFLGLTSRKTLTTTLRKVGTRHIYQVIANWKQFRERVLNSELAYCLEEEYGAGMEGSQGPDEGSEPGVGGPDTEGGDQSRPDETQGGDQCDMGPEYPPVAMGE